MKRVVMMGPPGAGKGTQGIRLAEHWKVPHIASGDLLRRLLAEEPESKLAEAARVINEGQMVSDEMAATIVFRALHGAEGFVLDGFPRNVAQAHLMQDFLTEEEVALDAVLYLEVPEEELVSRLTGRMTCVSCGETYHLTHEPPTIAWVCDRCGSNLEIRPDDHPDRIRTRFRLYQERTAPLVGWYREAGLLKHIDASGSPDDIFARCLKAVQ